MRLRACVFDDDDFIRSFLWRILDKRGYEVFTFPDPSLCALHLATECKCPQEYACTNIIISDMKMPNVSGMDFVKKQQEKGCKCNHIALMSGGWSEMELEHAAEIGCKVFVKPFKLMEIYRWLDEVEALSDPKAKLVDLPSLRVGG